MNTIKLEKYMQPNLSKKITLVGVEPQDHAFYNGKENLHISMLKCTRAINQNAAPGSTIMLLLQENCMELQQACCALIEPENAISNLDPTLHVGKVQAKLENYFSSVY